MLRSRLIIGVSLISVVCVIGSSVLYYWHVRSQRKLALLQTADVAEGKGDWITVESALRQYLELGETTPALLVRIAIAIESNAKDDQGKKRALPFYAKALTMDPAMIDARIRLADLQMHENPRQAIEQAEWILNRSPSHAGALRARAMASARLTRPSESDPERLLETYCRLRDANQRLPGEAELASQFAEFGRRHAVQIAKAIDKTAPEILSLCDAALDRLVETADTPSDARLTRFLYRQKHVLGGERDPRSQADVDYLVEARPSSSLIRMLAAGWELRTAFGNRRPARDASAVDSGALRQAKEHLKHAVNNKPLDAAPPWSLAQLQWWCGEHIKALETLESAQGEEPNLALALRSAEVAVALRDWESADRHLHQLREVCKSQRLEDNHPIVQTAEFLRIQWLLGIGNSAADPSQAIRRLNASRTVEAKGFRALRFYLLGIAHGQLGNWAEALKAFRRSGRVTDEYLLPQVSQAYALSRLGRFREAIMLYTHVLGITRGSENSINETQIWIELARCATAEQAELPAAQRRWDRFDVALAEVQKRLPDSETQFFLELATSEYRREAFADLDQKLSVAKERFSGSPSFWAQLAQFELQAEDVEGCQKALTQLEQLTSSKPVDLQIGLALLRGDRSEADRLLEGLSQSAPTHRKNALMNQRLRNAIAFDDPEVTTRLLETIRAPDATQIETLFQAAQLAWSKGNLKDLSKLSLQIKNLEGSESRRAQICRAQEAILLAAAQQPDAQQIVTQRLEKLGRDFPFDPQVFVLKALAAEQQGSKRDAIRELRLALRFGEQNPEIRLRLASLLHSVKLSSEAAKHCLVAHEQLDDARAGSLLARTLINQLDTEDEAMAEEVFEDILAKQTPGLAKFLVNLALLRESQNRVPEAIALNRQALEINPNSIAASNNLAWVLTVHGGSHEEALALVETTIARAGRMPALLDTKGVILLALGQSELALTLFLESIQNQNGSASRFVHLAEAYHDLGRNEEAAAWIVKAENLGTHLLHGRDHRALLRLKAATVVSYP